MIRENLVFFNDDLKNEQEILDFLTDKIDACGLLNDRSVYLDAVYRREAEFSTAVGFKVAIPHGMSDAVNEAFIAFLKTDTPVYWGKEQKEVQLIFLIGVPEHEKNITHLKFISQISKHLIDEEFREKLLMCKNCHEAFDILNVINEGIGK